MFSFRDKGVGGTMDIAERVDVICSIEKSMLEMPDEIQYWNVAIVSEELANWLSQTWFDKIQFVSALHSSVPFHTSVPVLPQENLAMHATLMQPLSWF